MKHIISSFLGDKAFFLGRTFGPHFQTFTYDVFNINSQKYGLTPLCKDTK